MKKDYGVRAMYCEMAGHAFWQSADRKKKSFLTFKNLSVPYNRLMASE
jgi:hypothetical protein